MISVLAADVGGTRTRTGLLKDNGDIVSQAAFSTLPEEGSYSFAKRLTKSLQLHINSAPPGDEIKGIGVSVASPVVMDTGQLIDPPNLIGPNWNGFSISDYLKRHFEMPVATGNDANLAALAEHRMGAGIGSQNMVFLTLSTGIGSGIIINNQLYTGANGFAGEIGHMTLDFQGEIGSCGNIGCFETMASGTAIANKAKEITKCTNLELRPSPLHKNIGALDVFESAKSGDSTSTKILAEVSQILAAGVLNIIHIFDPERIVIGGGLSNNLDLFLPQVEQYTNNHAMAHVAGQTRIVKAQLGDEVSLIGASILATTTLF